ncbi:hypothetical protein M316_0010 [Nitrincola phage 1M3-16]|uniref:hypothetical protein n=1 Tax=Nitrincola phage 1M3-16 TaxID=1472912 RepID=UPI000444CFD0|nr:hypothetical protein GJ22_gp142 [Nitrincola phage 1M3-16]AHX01075.1 hypothetical protein M316_0010 [Nitrincola phage 1M3-16]
MINKNKWQLTEEENSAFICQLNSKGSNRWFCGVQAGWEDDGLRISEGELHKIALKMAAAEELYNAIADLLHDESEDCIPTSFWRNAYDAYIKAGGGG